MWEKIICLQWGNNFTKSPETNFASFKTFTYTKSSASFSKASLLSLFNAVFIVT